MLLAVYYLCIVTSPHLHVQMTSTNLYLRTLTGYRYPLYTASLLLFYCVNLLFIFGKSCLNSFLNCTGGYGLVSKHFTVLYSAHVTNKVWFEPNSQGCARALRRICIYQQLSSPTTVSMKLVGLFDKSHFFYAYKFLNSFVSSILE